MFLKHFILPEMPFKQTCFFLIVTPLTHPTTCPQDYQGGDTKRDEGGLIKVLKQVDFEIHLGDLKPFLDRVFVCFFHAGWVGPDP